MARPAFQSGWLSMYDDGLSVGRQLRIEDARQLGDVDERHRPAEPRRSARGAEALRAADGASHGDGAARAATSAPPRSNELATLIRDDLM